MLGLVSKALEQGEPAMGGRGPQGTGRGKHVE